MKIHTSYQSHQTNSHYTHRQNTCTLLHLTLFGDYTMTSTTLSMLRTDIIAAISAHKVELDKLVTEYDTLCDAMAKQNESVEAKCAELNAKLEACKTKRAERNAALERRRAIREEIRASNSLIDTAMRDWEHANQCVISKQQKKYAYDATACAMRGKPCPDKALSDYTSPEIEALKERMAPYVVILNEEEDKIATLNAEAEILDARDFAAERTKIKNTIAQLEAALAATKSPTDLDRRDAVMSAELDRAHKTSAMITCVDDYIMYYAKMEGDGDAFDLWADVLCDPEGYNPDTHLRGGEFSESTCPQFLEIFLYALFSECNVHRYNFLNAEEEESGDYRMRFEPTPIPGWGNDESYGEGVVFEHDTRDDPDDPRFKLSFDIYTMEIPGKWRLM